MFWTDVGKHRIESSSMDGRSRKTIVSSQSVRKPTGIAVDHASHRIFWVDSGSTKGHLASSQFDGSDVRIIISELYNPFLGIAVFEDSVYWVDAGQSKLYEANKFSGASKREIDLGFFLLRDVAVYHPVAHMKGKFWPIWSRKILNRFVFVCFLFVFCEGLNLEWLHVPLSFVSCCDIFKDFNQYKRSFGGFYLLAPWVHSRN